MRFLTWLLRALRTSFQLSEHTQKFQRPRLRVEPLEDRTLLAANVIGLALDNDTGEFSNDGITYDATMSAEVTWTSSTDDVTVEFDHDCDGTMDGSVDVYTSGNSFVYDPVAADTTLDSYQGLLELDYRVVEHTQTGDIVGSWQDFDFTLDRVAPTVVSMTPADSELLTNTPLDADIVFSESISSASISASTAWVNGVGGTANPSQTVARSVADTVTVTFVGSGIPGGVYETGVDSIEDVAGNVLAFQETAEWRLTAAPTTSGIPDVNANEDDPNTVIDVAAYFEDEFDDPDFDLTYEIVSNTNTALFNSADIFANDLTLDYADDKYGTADITIRATDSDGLWVETVLEVDVASVNDAPEIIDFVGTEGPTVYTFEGQVLDESPGGLTITFGGLLDGHSTTTDSDGFFWYSLALTESGTVTSETTDSGTLTSNLASDYVTPST